MEDKNIKITHTENNHTAIKPKTNIILPVVPTPQTTPENEDVAAQTKRALSRKRIIIYTCVIFLVITGTSLIVWRLLANTKRLQVISNGEDIDKSALVIDTEDKSVGVASESPSGLQVEAKVSSDVLGKANVRLGLATDASLPSLLMESGDGSLWRMSVIDASLQFLQNTDLRMKLDSSSLTLSNSLNVDANTNLGNHASDTLTINGTTINMPNNLNFGGNALFINNSSKSIAVGAPSTNGYKLYVAGTLRADGQITAGTGSASSPGFSWVGNENTGIFRPSINVVGISSGGQEVLRVQQGSVLVLSGANLEVEGYMRAGRGTSNPSWRLARYTGTLDGSGAATINHGISSANSRVLTAQAWYRGNLNEAVPITLESVGGSSVQIYGGVPGRQYRVTIIYSQDSAGW